MATNEIKFTPRADIAKCEGIGCAFSVSCGRYLRGEEDNQTWSAYYALAGDDCDYFEAPVVVAG